MKQILKDNGYSLIELIIVILIIGVIATIGMKSSSTAINRTRTEETRKELEKIANAIRGNLNLVSAGSRTDYGYIGDNGALPLNLEALINNPGGYATWDGPYIFNELNSSTPVDYFKYDAWGELYSYSGLTITSTGGGTVLQQKIGNSINDLLYNKVQLVITDIAAVPPGVGYRDSIITQLTIPNGTGSWITLSKNPQPDGYLSFDSIPIGNHQLKIIYTPDNDTIQKEINVDPKNGYQGNITLTKTLY